LEPRCFSISRSEEYSSENGDVGETSLFVLKGEMVYWESTDIKKAYILKLRSENRIP
jgi:hypothetical protein